MSEPLPKTLPCKVCGKKPKRKIYSFGFSDKDDEMTLEHECVDRFIRYPERGRFSHLYLSGQELPMVKAWNEELGKKED